MEVQQGAPVGVRVPSPPARELPRATRSDDTRRRGPWRPVPADPNAAPPERGLYRWAERTLRRVTDAVVARRSLSPRLPGRQNAGWTPEGAATNGDGSIAPPRGYPIAGAPAPGAGRVVPPGLASGNTLFRYDGRGESTTIKVLDQGQSNGCGTTSLAMALNFFAGEQSYDRARIDAHIRRYDTFTSPSDMAGYVEQQGLRASVRDGLALDDLRALVDQGVPPIVLLDVSEAHDGSGLHYEVVTGYGTYADGRRYIELANPWGEREYMAEDAFLKRWSNLNMRGLPLGVERLAIVAAPPEHPARLPADRRGAWTSTAMSGLRAAEGLTDVTNGWARTDVPRLLAGVLRLVPGGIVALIALLGQAGRRWAERQLAEGRAELAGGATTAPRGLGRMALAGPAWLFAAASELTANVASRTVDVGAQMLEGVGG